jgi:uncharacterized protein (DUF305 family)
VSRPITLDAPAAAEPPALAVPDRRGIPAAALVAVAVLASVAAVLTWRAWDRAPGDGSLEAGFARDMIVHHDQAVAMALLARERTTNPAIATLATDILLSQQNQIGQMMGWLNVWGLPATGIGAPMSWMARSAEAGMDGMAMPMEGSMPGMATPEELEQLRTLSGDAFDAEFLRLMIRHHRGAIPMAEEALAGGDVPAVRDLARSIIASQEAEIAAMASLLEQGGYATTPS